VNTRRIIEVDLVDVGAGNDQVEEIQQLLHTSMLRPFSDLLAEARDSGDVASGVDPATAAAAIVAIVEGLGTAHVSPDDGAVDAETEKLVLAAVGLLLRGIRPGADES
jgi:hypothetical protein